MLDLNQLTQNFWKQCAPNFIYVNLLQYKLYWFKAAWKSPIKVTVQWEDEQAREILRRKTEEVGYHLREMDQ